MKKAKKLTKHQKEILDLTQKLSHAESLIRQASYKETDLIKKLQFSQKETADCLNGLSEKEHKIHLLSSEVRVVADGLFQAKSGADVQTLHRHIGYAEGRLDAAISAVSGYTTVRCLAQTTASSLNMVAKDKSFSGGNY